MKHTGEPLLKTMFAHRVRDVTPPGTRSDLSVLYMPSGLDNEFVHHCTSVLSQEELQTADALPSHEDKIRFIIRRAFRRFCGACVLGTDTPLSDIQFAQTEAGRPFLRSHPATSFSFSACSLGFVAAWSSQFRVGIDIEDPGRSVEALAVAESYFTTAEADMVRHAHEQERKKIFFRLWTLKEAALKSIGQGLNFGLDAFAFALGPDLLIASAPAQHGGEKKFQGHAIKDAKGCVSLVIH